jgi:mannose/fructose/N-acetylgalactosamine-specific phosphotransferase system component IIC
MTELSVAQLVLLVAWGMFVGLDLVSVPQALISRPLVAGCVAGWIAGDMEAGLRAGVLLELFALDVLPIGAVRYPDYGPATIAAAALGTGAPWELGLGLGAALGLVLAILGGASLQLVRRMNANAIQHRAAALAAGEGSAIRRLQYGALARDAVRGAGLTALGLAAAWLLAAYARLEEPTALGLTLVTIGCGLAAAVNGALRSAGRSARLRWLIAGVAVGLLLAVLR